ncbi:MAG: hypothetical protein H7222_00640 [Methylotenera sp.]|nr:hypothetical protein [Oligoflexia bacterium]
MKFETTVFMILVFVTSAGSQSGWAEDSKEQASVPQLNKAVTQTSKSEGFKLSAKAQETIGVRTIKVISDRSPLVSQTALVRTLGQIAVYRLRDGWFKLIPIELKDGKGPQVAVKSSELKPGDQIAVQGVALLRVSEMDAFGGGE